jgi:hypothetical protein
LNSNLKELNAKLGGEIKIEILQLIFTREILPFFSNEKNRQQNGHLLERVKRQLF